MKSVLIFKILLVFIIPFNLISQNTEKTFEIKTDLYLPTNEMLQVLYEFDKCNQENLLDNSKIYYSIQLIEKKHSEILSIAAGEKVIADVAVEWNKLNVVGALLFKNRILILDMSLEQLKKLGFLFNKTEKTIERTIKLDQYGTPMCFSNYLIRNHSLSLDYKSNNY